MSDFVPHLVSLSSCPTHAVRVVAAKALVPFISCEHLLHKAKQLTMLLPAPGQSFSQNVLHGTLLQIRVLLEAVSWSAVTKDDSDILKEFFNKIWICSCNNCCPLTRASFLTIVMKFGPLFNKDCECGNCLFVCLFDCIFCFLYVCRRFVNSINNISTFTSNHQAKVLLNDLYYFQIIYISIYKIIPDYLYRWFFFLSQ